MAGWNKSSNRTDFEKVLRYGFNVRRSHSTIIGRYLPVLEIILGLSLVLGVKVRLTAAGVILLLILFSGKLIRLRLAGVRRLLCGCFGSSQEEHSIAGLTARNALLVALAAVVAFIPSDFLSSWPAGPRAPEVVLTACTSIGCFLIVTMIPRIYLTFHGAGRTQRMSGGTKNRGD